MNWDVIGAIAELLGAIGVLLTLLYLAAQIRQNTRSNTISAEVQCLKLLTDWVGRISENDEKQRLYDLAAEDAESMTPEESRRYLWLIGEFG